MAQFRGLIDEVRIWRFALQDNNINNSGGNGNPSENFPQSLAQYLTDAGLLQNFLISMESNHLKIDQTTIII